MTEDVTLRCTSMVIQTGKLSAAFNGSKDRLLDGLLSRQRHYRKSEVSCLADGRSSSSSRQRVQYI